MDILNFISWIKGSRVVTTVDPTQTLLPVGLKDSRRDDGYLAGAISVEDFANQVGGLQTVAVDGVTITGDGTPGDPLVAAGGSSYKVYTALLDQSGTSNPVATVLENTFGISFNWTRAGDGNYQIQDFSNNPFTDNKTFGLCVPSGGSVNRILNFTQAFSAVVALSVLDPLTGSQIDLNGAKVQIEIRVYP